MKSFAYILSALAVVGLAYWAYRENYETQAAIARAERLQSQIGASRSRLAMLRAEWAYLNRPERLEELAELNFADLALLPMRPDQFGKADQVDFPAEPEAAPLIFNDPVDVSALNAPEVTQ